MSMGQGGGELNFLIGSAAQGIGTQTNGGPLPRDMLQNTRQLSSPIIQSGILRNGLQQTLEKVNNASYVEANFSKKLSAGQNFGNAAFNKNNEILGNAGKGFALFYR